MLLFKCTVLCCYELYCCHGNSDLTLTLYLLQLLDTLPVCKDFKLGLCQRPTCKYVHLIEGKTLFLCLSYWYQ